ncbi:MAG: hypothetical protein DRG55_03525 [Deltaproteobacteria bacterium]|nr:MAG: hypothetical protein DRG55_03525 [Deltaproteobacteria bacterium]
MGDAFLKFLGTAGARVVVFKQLRASGGLWLELNGTRLHIDPGPGALVRALSSRPKLDPAKLDALLLTHRHLDHSADINVMIEAMTEGGRRKGGVLFAPADALDEDPVVLNYVRGYLGKVEVLEEGKSYRVGGITFSTPLRHRHSVETYGLIVEGRIALISDTLFFPDLIEAYRGVEVLVINVVRAGERDERIEHLTLGDARELIKGIRPKRAILTHFGMTVLRAKPWEVAEGLSRETGCEVIAARDGMTLEL